MENLKLNTIWLSEASKTIFQSNLVIAKDKKYEDLMESLEKKAYYLHKTEKLINPCQIILDLLMAKVPDNFDLICLFGPFTAKVDWVIRYGEVAKAEQIVKYLEESPMPKGLVKHAVNRMWPNFGFFATECMDLMTIEEGIKYDIQELKDLNESCKANGFVVPEKIGDILMQETRAKVNERVLSLSKKVNAISK